MIYEKNGSPHPSSNRYYQVFEYMFVLSKGKPKTVNLLMDRENKWAGTGSWGQPSARGKDGKLKTRKRYTTPAYGVRYNIWRYYTGKGFSTKDDCAFEHAIFPEKLAEDHIKSWSNAGDLILNPFIGSGTTAKMALLNSRDFIAIDIEPKYCRIAEKRIRNLLISNEFFG